MGVTKDDKSKIQQIVGDCYLRAASIIIGSRIDETPTPRLSAGKRKPKFNLEIPELESVERQVGAWRTDFSRPLIIQLREYSRSSEAIPEVSLEESLTASPFQERGRLVEEWVLEWLQEDRSFRTRLDFGAIYKRMAIMLRSLVSYTCILPAFTIFQASRKGGGSTPRLHYNMLSSRQQGKSRREQGVDHMINYSFTPIETPQGFFKMSVNYVPVSGLPARDSNVSVKQLTSPIVISNYVARYRNSSSSSEVIPHASEPPPQVRRATTMQPERPGTSPGPPVDGGASPLSGAAPAFRRHSWSLTSARSQEAAAAAPLVSPSAKTPPSKPHSQASMRANRMVVPTFAPGTPNGSSATPPKYPSQALSERLAQAASQAASAARKMYSYSNAAAATFGKSPLQPSARNSPHRFEDKEMRRMSRQMSDRSGPSPYSASPSRGSPGMGSPSRGSYNDPVVILNGFTPSERSGSQRGIQHSVRGKEDEPFPTPFARSYGKDPAQRPATPPGGAPGLRSVASGSSSSFHRHMSSSPQLPFACTPSTNSMSDMLRKGPGTHSRTGTPSQGFQKPHGLERKTPSGPDTVSDNLSDNVLDTIDCSIATMLESAGSSLFSASAMAYQLPFSLESRNLSPHAEDQAAGSERQSSEPQEGGRVLTEQMLLMMDNPDQESLPFALEELVCSRETSGAPGELQKTTLACACNDDSDATVGAFMNLIQGAPPLERSILSHSAKVKAPPSPISEQAIANQSSHRMSLQSGLDQLAKFKLQLD